MTDIEREAILAFENYEDRLVAAGGLTSCSFEDFHEGWKAARAQPDGGGVPDVNDFKAEVRTERDPCDEHVSFLVFVADGKASPYLHIPETLDQDVLDAALRKLNAPQSD